MPVVALLTTIAVGVAAGGIAGAFNDVAAPGAAIGYVCGFMGGMVGLKCAVAAHNKKDLELSANRVGLTRGGEIVRRAQLYNFMGPALLGLIFAATAGALTPHGQVCCSPGPVDNAAEKKINQPATKIPENIPAVS